MQISNKNSKIIAEVIKIFMNSIFQIMPKTSKEVSL